MVETPCTSNLASPVLGVKTSAMVRDRQVPGLDWDWDAVGVSQQQHSRAKQQWRVMGDFRSSRKAKSSKCINSRML